VSDRPRSLRQVLATGAARVRAERGLDDEAAAELLRGHGLSGWQSGTVAQVEAGVRPLSVEELLLLCLAYGVTPADLLGPVDGDPVEVTAAARLTPAALGALLAGDGAAVRALPTEALDVPATRAAPPAGSPPPPDALVRSAARYGVSGEAAVGRALAGIGDAERNAARRLGVSAERLVLAAVGRWGRPLTVERDARIEQRRADTDPAVHITLRGLVTRELLQELAVLLAPPDPVAGVARLSRPTPEADAVTGP
jgi:transcriptional regulator with XRE-family HTH domain